MQVDKKHITHLQPAPVDNGRAIISHPLIPLKQDIIFIIKLIIEWLSLYVRKGQSSPLLIDKSVQANMGYVGRGRLGRDLDWDQESIGVNGEGGLGQQQWWWWWLWEWRNYYSIIVVIPSFYFVVIFIQLDLLQSSTLNHR